MAKPKRTSCDVLEPHFLLPLKEKDISSRGYYNISISSRIYATEREQKEFRLDIIVVERKLVHFPIYNGCNSEG